MFRSAREQRSCLADGENKRVSNGEPSEESLPIRASD